MSELQIGLLAIGALAVIGVLAYNRIQERGARRAAEQAPRSTHPDVLIGAAPGQSGLQEPRFDADPRADSPPPHAARAEAREEAEPQPDARIDYIIELTLAPPAAQLSLQPALQVVIQEQWGAIARRHSRRAMLAASADGALWKAGLQLVSRDGATGEAELIEFRSAVETLAAAIGASIAAPEMRAAVEAARELDVVCAEADIQVVMHLVAPEGTAFPGTKLRAALEAAGLALEADGRFAHRDDEQRLRYAVGARDGSPFSASTMRDATPRALSLELELARAPDTRHTFESMSRLARQLASVLGGSLVDDNGNALDERALAAIAQQLEGVSTRLQERGVAPGSPLAMRVFS